MFPCTMRMRLLTVVALTLGMPTPELLGQNPNFRAGPGMNMQQFLNQTSAASAPFLANAGTAGFTSIPAGASSLSSNPYASAYSNPYSSPYYSPYDMYNYDPAGAYLRGAADVINAQGQLMVNQQQSYQMREQVRQQMVATRRKAFDEYLYERESTPTAEDDRARFMKEQLSRSRNNPPVTEIMSGKALNDLLADLQRLSAPNGSANLRTFPVSLDEEGLKRINVAPSESKGALAMFKDAGKLNWPVALGGQEFKDLRERINSVAAASARQAEFNNQVDAGSIKQMTDDVARMRAALRKMGTNLSPAQYIDSKNFLDNLDSAVTALQQGNVGNYFTGKYSLKGKTVTDLIKYMTAEGLRFAPALPGEQASYQALYQALVQYDMAVQPTTAER